MLLEIENLIALPIMVTLLKVGQITCIDPKCLVNKLIAICIRLHVSNITEATLLFLFKKFISDENDR